MSSKVTAIVTVFTILWPMCAWSQIEGSSSRLGLRHVELGDYRYSVCVDVYPRDRAVYDVIFEYTLDGGRSYKDFARATAVPTGTNRCFTLDMKREIQEAPGVVASGIGFGARGLKINGGLFIRNVWRIEGYEVNDPGAPRVTFWLYDDEREPIGSITADDSGSARVTGLTPGEIYIVKERRDGWNSVRQMRVVVPQNSEARVTWVNERKKGNGKAIAFLAAGIGGGIIVGLVARRTASSY